jgi:DNA-binding LacI/PurR family transcriptional regulator
MAGRQAPIGREGGSRRQASLDGGRRRPPAMTDVAALAGVSYQTVSRVINAQPGVRPDTRERVLSAMRELHYEPNSLARSLVSGKSRAIGVISASSDLFGPTRTVHTVDEAVRQAGYATVIARVRQLDERGITDAAKQLRSRAVDGIVIAGSPQPNAAASVPDLLTHVPLVVIGRAPDEVPTIDIDARAGARAAVRHLLQLGHRTVWHVSGPLDWTSARQRLDGWRAELRTNKATAPSPVDGGEWTAKAGYEAGLVLARDPAVTAIFAASDHIALGLLRALSEAGRSVPQDVSIVGFDDIPEAAYFVPPLTTLRQDFSSCARLAVRALIAELEGDQPVPMHRRKIPPLVVRASTAAPSRAT